VISGRLLYAPNIHQGGGKSLLLPLLKELSDAPDVTFVLDERLCFPAGLHLVGNVYRVKATLYSRLKFEWQLRYMITQDTLLLCMGNLPPLFAHGGCQHLFIQNRYLIDDVSLRTFPLSVRIRLMLERWWLSSRASHVSRFFVQTPTMQRLMKNKLGQNAEVVPFAAIESMIDTQPASANSCHYDFLYVASGEPHKNHTTLLKAWIKLAGKGFFPSLCLTLEAERFPALCAEISAEIKKHGLNISMIGECSHAEIQQLYSHSAAMIYPSLFESFGLPLIEAAMVGLPVLASNAPYVTDVIEPTAVFDFSSPQSIADAVQVFHSKPALLKVQLLDVNEFLATSFSKVTSA